MLPFKMVINENKMFLFYALASKLFHDLHLNKKKVWNINTSLEVNYQIKNSPDLFNPSNKDISDFCPNKRAFLVIDKKVNDIYSNSILNYFDQNNIKYSIALLDGVETKKSLDSLLYLLEEIEKFNISRKSEPVIGIGGGVVLDVVGLAATLYRRGIPYIRIPTTLLGIIDVSVAAKTGINFLERRNRLGSYYPPVAAFLDKSFIKTVEPIEISSGLGEILKMAVIKDDHLFEILKNNGKSLLDNKFDCEYSDEVINLAIQGMKEELENNLWEKNLKRIVDFGHSFSPIIEMKSLSTDNPLTHGQAVTLDIIFSCIISYHRNMLSYDDVLTIIHVAKDMGLPTYHESFTNPALLLEALQDTMKHRNGDQNLPMPKAIGKSMFINNLTYDEIRSAASLFKKLHEENK
jgi:3-dehydroquinate synthase